VREDPVQVRTAELAVAKGAWVSHLVLAKTLWVLEAVYDLSREKIATAADMLLNHEVITVQDADVIQVALENFRARGGIDFSDCLVLEIARKAGHLPVAAFDRDFAKLEGVQRLR
jgi:predicted nucleic-acid-binding protein